MPMPETILRWENWLALDWLVDCPDGFVFLVKVTDP